MINAKLEIDSLLKKNKIVIFTSDKNNKSKETTNNLNTTRKKLKFNVEFNKHYETNKNVDESKLECIQLLEIYGISKRMIYVVNVKSLKNAQMCEAYLKAYYFSEQEIKFPLVFIHGIYFGSDDEIKLAHTEGFLFELFRDTGLYNLTRHISEKATNNEDEDDLEEDDDDYEDEDDDDDDEEYEDDDEEEEEEEADEFHSTYDENVNLAIDKVAKFNSESKIKKRANFLPFKSFNKMKAFESTQSFLDSEFSSLNSINKLSYCQNYIENNCALNKNNKSECSASLVDTEVSKIASKCRPPTTHRNSKRKSATKKTAEPKKLSEPSEVLATINKWLKQTKEIIEQRNKELIKKGSF